jgi:hypothetical protein
MNTHLQFFASISISSYLSAYSVIFYTNCSAVLESDVETKAGVTQLVNNLIMGLSNVQDRTAVRAELQAVLFEDKYKKTLAMVTQEIERMDRNIGGKNNLSVLAPPVGRKRPLGREFYPPNTIMPQGFMRDIYFSPEDCITVRPPGGKAAMCCCPTVGTMCGTLVAVKDLNKAIVGAFGMKKTKHRW